MTALVVGALVAAVVASPLVGWWRADAVRRRTTGVRPGSGSIVPGPVPPASLRARARGALGALGALVRRAARRPADPTADAVVGSVLVLGPLVALMAGPVVAVGVAAVAVVAPHWRRHRADGARRAAVRAVLPDVVDLFRLAVGAGLSVHQAIEVVAPRASPPLGPALDDVRRRVGLGVRLGDALDGLDDLGDEVRPLAAALAGAARYGSPLGAALDRVAVDARLLRRRRAEERARKLPVQLLFPLVMCVLPAFGLLAVVPLLAGSLPSLGAL